MPDTYIRHPAQSAYSNDEIFCNKCLGLPTTIAPDIFVATREDIRIAGHPARSDDIGVVKLNHLGHSLFVGHINFSSFPQSIYNKKLSLAKQTFYYPISPCFHIKTRKSYRNSSRVNPGAGVVTFRLAARGAASVFARVCRKSHAISAS